MNYFYKVILTVESIALITERANKLGISTKSFSEIDMGKYGYGSLSNRGSGWFLNQWYNIGIGEALDLIQFLVKMDEKSREKLRDY